MTRDLAFTMALIMAGIMALCKPVITLCGSRRRALDDLSASWTS